MSSRNQASAYDSESAGPVASDSLAAESYNADGEFTKNRNAAPGGVSGEASTFSNQDTSAASRLDPASSAGERGDFDDNYRGSAGNNSTSTDKAPDYVADVYLGDTSKPKGNNLTEDNDMSGNRKYDGDIGSKNDPGRAALRDFETSNSSVATGQAGGGQESLDSENAFDGLKRNERV